MDDIKSSEIGKLAEALAKAQAEIKAAIKDKNNPFFKSSYAGLEDVWDACREPLSKNGLSVTQPFFTDANGKLFLITILMHVSGQWIKSTAPINPVKNDPQSAGSAITYMRRFSLSAIVGIVPSEKPTENDENPSDRDDDGNAASGKEIPITMPQLTDLYERARRAGFDSKPKLADFISKRTYKTSFADLTNSDYEKLCILFQGNL